MANTRNYSRSFGAGEISKEMYGRIDDAKFQAGAAKLRNFIATPQGPGENRPGFAFVCTTKNNGRARLIPFTYSTDQTMVIELGAGYFRFHTQGATLDYNPSDATPWVPPSHDISLSLSSPSNVTWNGHGLTTGDPIRFYIYGSYSTSQLPVGLRVGYTYTVNVIDANTFQILDNGNPVGLAAPSGGGGGTTIASYSGAGTPSVNLTLAPTQSGTATSPAAGSFGSVAVPGGIATLNANLGAQVNIFQGGGSAQFQYTTDGTTWNSFHGTGSNETTSVHIPINVTNLNTLKVRVLAAGGAGPAGSVGIQASIDAWSVDVPTTIPTGTVTVATVRAYRYYAAGDMVSYGGGDYAARQADSGGMITPGSDATIWALLPSSGIYEIPNAYVDADLFDVHYVQSADVLTLVHPKYPPMELRRLGAAAWSFTQINFGPALDTPLNVAAQASPGYKAQVTSISNANPAIIRTLANHTLALGDGIYIDHLIGVNGPTQTDLSGFYLVNLVPSDSSGNLILNQLQVMDYNGNILDGSAYSSFMPGATIEIGNKIFDINTNYAVTALAADGLNQSKLSGSASARNNLDVPGSFNTVTWSDVDGANSYYVFKQKNGLWGYIGEVSTGTTFTDDNIAPDFSISPPYFDDAFKGPGNYPGAVSYFEQRRTFAGTLNAPDNIWMTNSGTESTLSYRLPTQDTDRIAFRVAAREANTIRHIVPMNQLLLLTSAGEWVVAPVNSDAVTPTSIGVKPQAYMGANNVQPTIVNYSMVYAAARGGHVRELAYAWTVAGFTTGDLSLRAAHLFDNLTIVDQTYSKAPRPIIWFVSSSGKLLGLTYIPEQQVGSWHQHDTDGAFESICCVAEGPEDRLYAVINRTVNGQTVRYIERMASRLFDNLEDCFFLDAGATFTSATPVTTISGLDWLEGKQVAILGDGAVLTPKVVVGGQITLSHSAKVVQVGLPITFDLQTLPLVMQIDGFGQGRTKNVNKVWIKLWRSSGLFVGPDTKNLVEYKQRTCEPLGAPPMLLGDIDDEDAEEIEVTLMAEWKSSGQVLIRQTDPLPLTIVGLTMDVAIGG